MTDGKLGSATTSGWFMAMLLSALLAGCGGGGDGGDATTTVSGTAASGKPISGGTVEMVCFNNAVGTAVTTGANGGFTVSAAGSAPCVIRVSGGTNNPSGPLISVVASSSQTRVNVNQLTHMLASLLAGANPDSGLFQLPGSIASKITAAAMATHKETVRANVIANLAAAAVISPSFDFLEGTFTANSTGFDLVLDKLGLSSAAGAFSIMFNGAPILSVNMTTGAITPSSTGVISAATLAAAGPSGTAGTTAGVTPVVPGTPVIGTAAAGNTQATVAFTAPSNNGGSAITGYTATCGTLTATGAASPLTVTGLTNGATYTCTVTATNAIGTSVASAASNSVTPSPNANTWATKTPMPTARWASGLGEIGGVIYVAGGYNPALGSHLTTVEAYTLASNSWLLKTARPNIQTSPASAVVGGLLYTFGGTDCCVNTATVMAYNPATDGWTAKTSMTLGVRSAGAAGAIGGIINFVGGHNDSGPTTFNEAFDPVANTWSTKTPMPTARTGLGAGVAGGILYVVGGNLMPGYTGTLEAYDPVANTWSTKAPMPTPRADMVVGVINGILYAAGGNNGNHLATVEAYNPGTNTWSTVAPLPTARTAAKGTVINGVLYVIGGYTGVNTAVGTVEAYTP